MNFKTSRPSALLSQHRAFKPSRCQCAGQASGGGHSEDGELQTNAEEKHEVIVHLGYMNLGYSMWLGSSWSLVCEVFLIYMLSTPYVSSLTCSSWITHKRICQYHPFHLGDDWNLDTSFGNTVIEM